MFPVILQFFWKSSIVHTLCNSILFQFKHYTKRTQAKTDNLLYICLHNKHSKQYNFTVHWFKEDKVLFWPFHHLSLLTQNYSIFHNLLFYVYIEHWKTWNNLEMWVMWKNGVQKVIYKLLLPLPATLTNTESNMDFMDPLPVGTLFFFWWKSRFFVILTATETVTKRLENTSLISYPVSFLNGQYNLEQPKILLMAYLAVSENISPNFQNGTEPCSKHHNLCMRFKKKMLLENMCILEYKTICYTTLEVYYYRMIPSCSRST